MISVSKVPYKRIRIFLNPQLFLSGFKNVHVHTYPVNSTYESATFLIPEGKFLNTLWIRNLVDAKSGYFVLSGDLTRSSPAVYCEYCIQDGNLDACSVANIPRGVLGTRGNPDARQIRVDGLIRFEYGYVWTWKFFNPERKSWRFKNIRIHVEEGLIVIIRAKCALW